MSRLFFNFLRGVTTNAPLAFSDTTLNASGSALPQLGTIASPDYVVLVLDPLAVNGDPEIVFVTAHTGTDNNATISRGQEGSAARDHPVGTDFIMTNTAYDWSRIQPDETTRADFATVSAGPLTIGAFSDSTLDTLFDHDFSTCDWISRQGSGDHLFILNEPGLYRLDLELQHTGGVLGDQWRVLWTMTDGAPPTPHQESGYFLDPSVSHDDFIHDIGYFPANAKIMPTFENNGATSVDITYAELSFNRIG